MRGGKKKRGKEEKRRGQGRGACQPPASSNYQCEWSVVAGAMGLISALLKETRPCPPVPLGGCWSSIPHYRQPVIFSQPKHTHLNRGKTLQTPQFRHNWGALTPWHTVQQFCIREKKKKILISRFSVCLIFPSISCSSARNGCTSKGFLCTGHAPRETHCICRNIHEG